MVKRKDKTVKYCKKCKKVLRNYNKTGFCSNCYNKTQAESGHKSKILVGVMILSMLFLMNFAVAEELMTFDNVKSYDPVLQKVTIENTFGLGRTITDIKLNTPKNNIVPSGENILVAEFTLNSYDDLYTDAFEKIEFYEKNVYESVGDRADLMDKRFTYKLKTYENVTYHHYETNCTNNYDGKLGKDPVVCYGDPKILDTYYVQEVRWIDFDPKQIYKGEYTIGIFTDVNFGDSVEWIPTFYGIKINEWASYTASLKAGMLMHFSLDESSGVNIRDNHSNNLNGTIMTPSAIGFQNTGILGNSIENKGAGAESYAQINNTVWFGSAYSINFWANLTSVAGTSAFISKRSGDSFECYTSSSGTLTLQCIVWIGASLKSCAVSTSGVVPINHTNWTMITVTYDGSKTVFYLWGSMLTGGNCTTASGNVDNQTGVTSFLDSDGGAGGFNGKMDEFGIWNRALTPAEIKELYNNGAGLSYWDTATPPIVYQNSPIDYYNSSVSTVAFNYTVHTTMTGSYINQTELYLDGVSEGINTTDMANGTTYLYSKAFSNGLHNWSVKTWDSNGSTNQSVYRYFNVTVNPPNVTIHFPYLNSNWSNTYVHFNATITDDFTLQNVTMYLDGAVNNTNTSGIEGLYQWDFYLSEGNHNWSILAYDNDSNAVQSSTIYFSVDTLNPVLSTTGAGSKYNSTFPINVTWSLFNADPHADKCWYYTSENSTNISVVCNSSTITNFTSHGSKTIYYFGNDTLGHQSTGSTSLFIGYYPYTQSTNKANVGSGDSVVFTLYVNGTDVSNQFSSTTATLNFNGTSYTPDTTDRTNQNYTKYTKTLYMTIGNSTGANTQYNWSYSIKNSTDIPLNVTTSTATIKVYLMAVRECLAGDRYILNASIKDEKLNSLINASLNATLIEIDLTVLSRANTSATWNFSKAWINNNTVYVCVPPNILTYSSYKIDFTIGYSANDYVQEFYYMDNGTIDSTNYFNSYTTNPISLYDLPLVDSTTFLFSFKDEDNLEVDDAIVHVYRKYIGDGVFREVERAEQDDNGETHIHLVEEDVIYYFMISQYGHIIYTSSQYNAKCLDTPCQIELSASTEFVEFPTDYDKINGTTYTLTSSKTTRTVTLIYGSNASQIVNLSLFKVVDGAVVYINTTSETGTSGSISLSIPLAQGNETFFASIFANGVWIRSEWIDMKEKAQDYFGTTGAILGGLLVLTLIFMAISEGVMLIVVGIVAIFIIVGMQLVDMSWLAIISIVVAGALIIWKMTQGGNKR